MQVEVPEMTGFFLHSLKAQLIALNLRSPDLSQGFIMMIYFLFVTGEK